MVAGTADQIRKQVEVILPDDPMEAQLRIVGPAFLHDRNRDNLRVGHLHAVGPVAEPDPVGRGFMATV